MIYQVVKLEQPATCHRCNSAAYWTVFKEVKPLADTCAAHLGSTIVQADRRA